MQLERATSTNSEAGLAGWISSNDVTLFTMILVVIVALFLHIQLTRGQDEYEQLSNANESLHANLGMAKSERDQLTDQLRDRDQTLATTRENLLLTQQERDRLNQQLLDAARRIANLDKTIAAISTEKASLETDAAALKQRRTELEADKARLSQRVETLTSDTTSLADEKKSLTERMAELATQLEAKLESLTAVEAERERLRKQSDQLDAIVATLEKKLAAAGTELSSVRAEAGETALSYQQRITALEKTADDEARRAEDYLARLRRAAEIFQGLKKSNANLESQLVGAQQRFERQLKMETTVNRKLVGINGKLKRVALLFDASGSMKQKDDEDGADRWQEAQEIASTWLGHLDLDECVLIVFSSDVRTFPSDGRLAKIQGPAGDANRAQLMAQLNSVEPEGWTNTLEALKKAYSYDGIDTILLFSDGAPTFANSGRFDPEVAQQIYTLCRSHAEIPVNTVGLGNYFDQNLSTFLRTVASVSGGTFRGR